MSRMIQIRNVPDELHRTLKARAALEGVSLSDYILEEMRNLAARPTPTEMRDRLEKLTPVTPKMPPVLMIREAREGRRY